MPVHYTGSIAVADIMNVCAAVLPSRVQEGRWYAVITSWVAVLRTGYNAAANGRHLCTAAVRHVKTAASTEFKVIPL